MESFQRMVDDANHAHHHQVQENDLIESEELMGEGKRHRYTTWAKN